MFPGDSAHTFLYKFPRQELPMHQVAGDCLLAIVELEKFFGPGRRVLNILEAFSDQSSPPPPKLGQEQISRAALIAVEEGPGQRQEHDVPKGQAEKAVPKLVLGVITAEALLPEVMQYGFFDPRLRIVLQFKSLHRHLNILRLRRRHSKFLTELAQVMFGELRFRLFPGIICYRTTQFEGFFKSTATFKNSDLPFSRGRQRAEPVQVKGLAIVANPFQVAGNSIDKVVPHASQPRILFNGPQFRKVFDQ